MKYRWVSFRHIDLVSSYILFTKIEFSRITATRQHERNWRLQAVVVRGYCSDTRRRMSQFKGRTKEEREEVGKRDKRFTFLAFGGGSISGGEWDGFMLEVGLLCESGWRGGRGKLRIREKEWGMNERIHSCWLQWRVVGPWY